MRSSPTAKAFPAAACCSASVPPPAPPPRSRATRAGERRGECASRTRLAAVPQAVGAAVPGLTYIGIDAQQFFPAGDPSGRLYEDLTGTKTRQPRDAHAGLPVPAGFDDPPGQRRVPGEADPLDLQAHAPAAGGELDGTRARPRFSPAGEPGWALLVHGQSCRTRSPSNATRRTRSATWWHPGQAIFGCTIGYLPPTQGFVPFSGGEPRVLDTRLPGPLSGKLANGQEKVVPLGFAGRPDGLDQPDRHRDGRRWFRRGVLSRHRVAGQLVDQLGRQQSDRRQRRRHRLSTPTDSIKIRGGANPTHVIIDRIGFMV